jgi:hypothetical protein
VRHKPDFKVLIQLAKSANVLPELGEDLLQRTANRLVADPDYESASLDRRAKVTAAL